ncbi:aminotransferase class V-fold PLP-dependent enzyme [Limobrevibacterium gyesilva]|uniref:Aminotransferase class V-fold PLP-dependent enzyme n=1 Tax=Limobrevibacterium gyesilva TaxID=2991712 RepID=A0AA41YUK4_9PROT|nr:aminotransferase class V-fold PLP-dependent enzyme [Limobrevibacterium gyesilva]MCW3476858.1 aminotransferase class V-fold PLP-dependent enzyme [Limobrevibacterium gyesilva]
MEETQAATPLLGAAIRHEWALDWNYLTVNHGSFGATPKVVLAAQDEWRRQLEAQPSRFMRRILPDALRDAAARLGRFVGAEGTDLAFVENATVGCNAVLRSLRLAPGDEIVVLTHVYGAVRNTVRYVTERAGARMVEVAIPFPRPDSDAIVANLASALTSCTRIAVLDHITSSSALVLPIARMIEACHAAGVPTLVDGAHGPGQVTLDVTALGVDWYVGNCHKWLMAPKGCAFLYARPDRREDLHPVTISHGYGKGFLAEFDWTGTWDPSAYLAVTAAIDFHHRLGGAALRARNAALAAEGAALVAGRLGTETGSGNELAGAMGLVRLPLTGAATAERALALRGHMLDANTDVPLHVQEGAVWLRLSAQAYNEVGDYEKLAGIVADVLATHG